MLSSVVTLNGQRQSEVMYSYDELGRPNGREFLDSDGNTLASESVNFNLQGWRTGSTVNYDGTPVFTESLGYYNPQDGTPQYSGMISETVFGHWDMMNMHSYSYDYDGLGRLSSSAHFINGSLVDENFETGFRYDRNGNLLALQRYGITANPFTHDYLADDLSYAYDGNRLEHITNRALPQDETMETEDDPGTEYSFSYDSNGSITHDDHQGLDISYNVLNFPCRFYDIDSMTETSYIYLSDGIKRSVSMHDGLGKLYRGSFVYDGGTAAGRPASLESIATPEGRLFNTDNGILDLWYAKDYLGNVRSVIDLASGVIEENDYLPFGTKIQDDNQPAMSDNRWRYANKEEQSSLVGGRCKLIDFGARNYDPWSARWTTIDPMAQKYFSLSPYNYCAGNPVMLVDPDGAWIEIQQGDSLYRYDSGSLYLYNKSTASFEECDIQPGSFVEKVFVSVLQLLNSDTGSELVSFFSNDENNVRIHPGDNSSAKNGMENSSRMVLNPLGKGSEIPTENGIEKSPLWLDLGHELAHRKDFIERGYKNATKMWCGLFPNSEKVATHYENLIRQETGLPLRTHYAIEEQTNTPYQPSWLIRSNSESRFYRGVFYIPFSQRNF